MAASFSLLGLGRVGLAFGRALMDAGWRLDTAWTRSAQRAQNATRLLIHECEHGPTPSVCPNSDLLLLAVSDAGIAELSASLPSAVPGQVRLHASGALPFAILGTMPGRGNVHPLVAVPDACVAGTEAAVASLRRAFFAIDGDEQGLLMARRIAVALGGAPMHLEASQRGLYHAAAALLGNGMVALFDAAQELLLNSGFDGTQSQRALNGLAASVLGNLEAQSPPMALTGPVRRADVETVLTHISSLRRFDQEEPAAPVLPLYQALLPRLIDISARAGVDEARLEALKGACT
ncbi:MAG: DUF2520 domain-containing protein [Myxococcota bacterium]|jgi:predicted short-subunit dehydrogenase-like oxidoreductase (DUF2520 family)|nr:DUF2520 domain-containing protein [Myxococcota bacterium]